MRPTDHFDRRAMGNRPRIEAADGTALALQNPANDRRAMEDSMTEQAPIKPKTPPAGNAASIPEPQAERKTGDCEGWGERGAKLAPEGQDLLKPGKFLQAMGDWKAKGLSKVDPKTQPGRRSQDRLST
jgi:hypothetical protein